MKNLTATLIVTFLTASLGIYCQVIEVNKLGNIFESDFSVAIESSGRFSYAEGQSILYSDDEGVTWDEIQTPFNLEPFVCSPICAKYKALRNGNYIVHTNNTMHYLENEEWRLLLIDGDSIFDNGPFVVDDQVVIIKDNALFVYNDNTKSIRFEKDLEPYCCYRISSFENHFLLRKGNSIYEIWTNEFEQLLEADFQAYVTREGHIVKLITTNNSTSDVFGNTIEISKDGGETYSLLLETDSEEYRIVGDLNGRLYFRGWISQREVWSLGHHQSRMGYIDTATRNVVEIADGSNRKFQSGPSIGGGDLYEDIGGTIIKYPKGNLNEREVIRQAIEGAMPIEKIRKAPNGTMYALGSTFLHKSENAGQDWSVMLDYNSVNDFDVNEDGDLFCLSNDKILKSTDDGQSFVEISKSYSLGQIDYPNEIISIGQDKLIVKGLGHRIEPSVLPTAQNIGCYDCYLYYPNFVFLADTEETILNPEFIFGGDFPLISSQNIYGIQGDNSIQSDYYIKSQDKLHLLTDLQYSNIDKLTFQRNTTIFDKNSLYDIDVRYGLSITGDIIQNENGFVSYSTDLGENFIQLGGTNYGKIYPGSREESLYVISTESSNKGALTFQADYNSPFRNLTLVLKDSGVTVADSIDWVYSTPSSEFFFAGTDTYEMDFGTTPVSEVDNTAEVKIFPNPTSDYLNITLGDNTSKFELVKVFDSMGRLIETLRATENQIMLDMMSYNQGLYFIQLEHGDKMSNFKVLKIEQ